MDLQLMDQGPRNIEKIKKATALAASRVDELVFSYGYLRDDDPERVILENQISEILRQWALLVGYYGARPMELWTVAFKTPDGEKEWQYPCSSFVEGQR